MIDNIVLRIIKSRLKNGEDKETKRLRKICKDCLYNSKNLECIPIKKRILIFLSDTLSWVMGRKAEDSLGNCMACASCSIYYKTREYEWENCPKDKWKNK